MCVHVCIQTQINSNIYLKIYCLNTIFEETGAKAQMGMKSEWKPRLKAASLTT